MKTKGDNILIELLPDGNKTKSGIILLDTTKPRNHSWGIVKQTNDHIESESGERIKVGQRVLFTGKPKEIINNRQILYWE